jgi:hypothetical protein
VVTPPKAGAYTGSAGVGRDITVYVTGRASNRSISIVAFKFACGKVSGRTSLNDIPLTRTRLGYRFGIRANGLVTYLDGHTDENAAIQIRGRFNRRGTRAAGFLRVRAPHCRDTGQDYWSVRRPQRRSTRSQ